MASTESRQFSHPLWISFADHSFLAFRFLFTLSLCWCSVVRYVYSSIRFQFYRIKILSPNEHFTGNCKQWTLSKNETKTNCRHSTIRCWFYRRSFAINSIHCKFPISNVSKKRLFSWFACRWQWVKSNNNKKRENKPRVIKLNTHWLLRTTQCSVFSLTRNVIDVYSIILIENQS